MQEITVAFETAVKLKEAGFPQPIAQAGQFWWGKKNAGEAAAGSLCVLIGTDTGEMRFRPINGIANEDNKFFVFAPQAHDILRELSAYCLFFDDGYLCYKIGHFPSGTKTNDNPHEAAALAFLAAKGGEK